MAVARQLAELWQGWLLQAFRVEQPLSGIGSGLVPGGQEHFGLCCSGRQTALTPQESLEQTSIQVKLRRSQNLLGGQSALVRQLTARHPTTGSVGSPLNLPGGQVQRGEWFWVMQTAWGPQEIVEQAGIHFFREELHTSSSPHWASD